MTNQDVWRIALQQSAYDCGCEPSDFLGRDSIVTLSRQNPLARKYLPLPFSCDLVSYGRNIVAQVSPELAEPVQSYIRKYPMPHGLEPPNLQVLEALLRPHGLKVCFMAEYFLPDLSLLQERPCNYTLRVLRQPDFAGLYLPQWSNALCAQRRELDVLGVGAYDGETLVALAGCSADCETMY